MFTLIALNNNTSMLLNSTFSIFYNISTLSAFLSTSIDSFTSIFVNKLATNLTTQETRLSSALSANAEIELKRTFNYYAKLRSAKNSSMNSLIDLIALLNCDSIVIKTILALFVKAFFTNFHKLKLYKKAITDAQHKINWQFNINNEIILYKNNKIWILIKKASKKRKIFINKWVYRCKKNINEKITRYKACWYVQNFEQLKNFNYHKIFVSIIKLINYKVIFVIAIVNN